MGFRDTISNFARNVRNLNKSYTETTTRPSVATPYMSTDTGAKLPIFPFPLIMIYELADNIVKELGVSKKNILYRVTL